MLVLVVVRFWLTVVHRTDDPNLVSFLKLSRVKQPERAIIREFFGDRLLKLSLGAAVKFGLAIQQQTSKLFVQGRAVPPEVKNTIERKRRVSMSSGYSSRSRRRERRSGRRSDKNSFFGRSFDFT